MSTPNPFLHAGALIGERQRRNRQQFKVAVYAALAAHAMLVLGLLFQGCESDDSVSGGASPEVTGPAGSTANPVPAAQPQPETNPPASRATVASAVAFGRRLPEPTAPQAASGEVTYVVKSGDTVGRIAKAHGTTAQALRAANNLKNDRLLVGMRLKIPAAPAGT